MDGVKGLSLQVPERVYASSWSPITEAARWALAKELGLQLFPLEVSEVLGEQLVTTAQFDGALGEKRNLVPRGASEVAHQIVFNRLEKNLSATPLGPETLWHELLPFPFCNLRFSSNPSEPALSASLQPEAFQRAVQFAYDRILHLEASFQKQELSALVINTESENKLLIAFQIVRRKRIRSGMLSGAAVEWFEEKLQNLECAPEGMPRMQFYWLNCGIQKSVSSDSIVYPLPAVPEPSDRSLPPPHLEGQ